MSSTLNLEDKRYVIAGGEHRQQRDFASAQSSLRKGRKRTGGTLKISGQDSKRLLTQIPPALDASLARLGLLPLFAQPPTWAGVARKNKATHPLAGEPALAGRKLS
jgi:hypothetical protein